MNIRIIYEISGKRLRCKVGIANLRIKCLRAYLRGLYTKCPCCVGFEILNF